MLTAPFRSLANLGTKAGNATRRGGGELPQPRSSRRARPRDLKYSQKNADWLTGDGKATIDDMARDMSERGYWGKPVDVVDNGPGGLMSIDNRRVVAANRGNVDRIPVKVHAPDEPFNVPPERLDAFKLQKPIYRMPDGTLRDRRRPRSKGGGVVAYPKGATPTDLGRGRRCSALPARAATSRSPARSCEPTIT